MTPANAATDSNPISHVVSTWPHENASMRKLPSIEFRYLVILLSPAT
jgi:hypothetical protein